MILDLYQGFYGGKPLGPGDRILSFDAKPSIQARGRIHQTLPAASGKQARVEHEYVRHGALALLAGLDIQTGQIRLHPQDHGHRPVHGPRRAGHGPAGERTRTGCSSSGTTARTTAARPPSTGSARPTRTRS